MLNACACACECVCVCDGCNFGGSAGMNQGTHPRLSGLARAARARRVARLARVARAAEPRTVRGRRQGGRSRGAGQAPLRRRDLAQARAAAGACAHRAHDPGARLAGAVAQGDRTALIPAPALRRSPLLAPPLADPEKWIRSLGMVWYSVVRCGAVRCGMVSYGWAWYGMAWHGMVWHGRVEHVSFKRILT